MSWCRYIIQFCKLSRVFPHFPHSKQLLRSISLTFFVEQSFTDFLTVENNHMFKCNAIKERKVNWIKLQCNFFLIAELLQLWYKFEELKDTIRSLKTYKTLIIMLLLEVDLIFKYYQNSIFCKLFYAFKTDRQNIDTKDVML